MVSVCRSLVTFTNEKSGGPMKTTERPGGTQIDSLSQESRLFAPRPEFRRSSLLPDLDEYRRLHALSLSDPENFWADMAGDFFWFRKWSRVLDYDWKDTYEVRWFDGAQTNLCANA